MNNPYKTPTSDKPRAPAVWQYVALAWIAGLIIGIIVCILLLRGWPWPKATAAILLCGAIAGTIPQVVLWLQRK